MKVRYIFLVAPQGNMAKKRKNKFSFSTPLRVFFPESKEK